MIKPLVAVCLAALLALGACASEPSYHVQPKDPRRPELIASAPQQQDDSQTYVRSNGAPTVSYSQSEPERPMSQGYGASSPSSSQTSQSAAVERTVDTIRLHVDGMTCPVRCPREIKEMLSKVPGIIGDPAVDVPSQTVLVNVPHGMNPQPIVDAITSPYRARLL
jgi:copper chaperone CopZ